MKSYTRNWIITLLCCSLCFLYYGMGRLSAQLFPATMETYGLTRSQASFPFFFHYLMRSLSGPIVGYLGNRFDPCYIVISAAILASIGVPTCCFASNIQTIVILWGGVFGFASGMATNLFPIILERNWDKKSMAANGISVGGGSAGAIIFPIIVAKLLDVYGTHGCFMLIGGIILNGVPIAMYLLTLDTESKKLKNKNVYTTNLNIQKIENNSDIKTRKKTRCRIKSLKNEENLITVSFIKLKEINELNGDTDITVNVNREKLKNTQLEDEVNSYKDIDTRNQTNSSEVSKKCKLHQDTNMISIIQTVNQESAYIETKTEENSFMMFFDITFIFLLLTQGLYVMVNTIISTVIVDFCKDIGIDQSNQLIILTVLSVSDTIGRIFLGFIVDKTCITAVRFTWFCALVMASAIYLLTLSIDIFAILSCVVVYGLCAGGCLATCPGIFSENLEKYKLPMAYASRFILFVPLSLAQSPLIGFFRGRLGSYNYVFYFCSAIQVIICIIVILSPSCAKQFRNKKNTSNSLRN